MDNVLIMMAVALWVGWGVWWWLIRGNTEGAVKLARQLEELEKRNEPK